MRSPTVVVLGSKPGATWPLSHHLYLANRALTDYPQATEATITLHLVGVWKSVFDALRSYAASSGKKQPIESLTVWNNGSLSRTVLKSLEAADATAFCRSQLSEAKIAVNYIQAMNPVERRAMWEDLTGLREPIADGISSVGFQALWEQRAPIQKYLRRRLVALPRGRSSRPHAPGIFRPSTGVMALCLAIRNHGDAAKYVIAGIGLSRRSEYLPPRKSSPSDPGLPRHTYADKKILSVLSQQFSLTTTEPELFSVVPAFVE